MNIFKTENIKTFLILLIVVLSILGMADAGYITYEKFSGIIPPCGEGFDCGKVLESPWSNIGPIPLSLLGLLYYAAVFKLAILYFLEIDLKNWIKKIIEYLPFLNNYSEKITPFELLKYITAFGFVFSMYLVFLMGVVIQGWCLYCLISAGTSTSLFIIVQLISYLNRKIK